MNATMNCLLFVLYDCLSIALEENPQIEKWQTEMYLYVRVQFSVFRKGSFHICYHQCFINGFLCFTIDHVILMKPTVKTA